MTDSETFQRVTLFGTPTCADCRRSRAEFARLGVEFDDIDIAEDEAAASRALAISGRTSTPLIVFPDGTHLVEPTNAELETKLQELRLI